MEIENTAEREKCMYKNNGNNRKKIMIIIVVICIYIHLNTIKTAQV